jgi:hypothetical protein
MDQTPENKIHLDRKINPPVWHLIQLSLTSSTLSGTKYTPFLIEKLSQ